MKIILLFLMAMLLVGCTYTLTPAGAKVRVTSNQEAVKGCEFKGAVKGTDRLNGGLLGQDTAADNVTIEMQNKAATMGADTVLLMTSQSGMNGARATGEAYDCSKKKEKESASAK